MDTTRRFLALTATTGLLLALMSGVAAAVEAGGDKITLFDPSSPRDVVGVAILGVVSLIAFAAFVNAVRQLAGKRRQADGKFRWR